MVKRIGVIALLCLLTFLACSDDKGNVTSGAIEETNALAQKSSSSGNKDVKGESSGSEVPVLSEMDSNYIIKALNSYVSSEQFVSGDDDEDDADPVVSLSPVEYNFTSPLKKVYGRQENCRGACYVLLFEQESGIRWWGRSYETGENNVSILLKEVNGDLFEHYLQSSSFYNDNVKLCVSDSLSFVEKCKTKGGLFKVYNNGCEQEQPYLEMACVSKIPDTTELDAMAETIAEDCENFISGLTAMPPDGTTVCPYPSDEEQSGSF